MDHIVAINHKSHNLTATNYCCIDEERASFVFSFSSHYHADISSSHTI